MTTENAPGRASAQDSDRPIDDAAKDRFGFAGIASRLAPAIIDASAGDGMVIGLEGPWGSGKTTLLNFLRGELHEAKTNNTHVITISPWLSGDASSLVDSLLTPISEVLDKAEGGAVPEKGWSLGRAKKTKLTAGAMLRQYGATTGRALAPIARFAGNFIPGAALTGEALDLGSQYLEQFVRTPTTAEIKDEIARKISALDVRFIVILDDLDRLEPRQAVEVIRLVRSVADFPRVVYLMCYDRAVVAQALKNGLEVEDGDVFLQKIIQLTFAIPLPEPFDLRSSFFEEAVNIYKEVTGSDLPQAWRDDLASAVDVQGAGLRTPREVKLALNGVRFLYPSTKEEVYFPDLCRLHLIRTTHGKLYNWLEEYLSVRSVVVSGDGSVGADERLDLGKRLLELMPSDEASSSKSIWSLRTFVPGLIRNEDPKKTVFTATGLQETREFVAKRRLGSPLHYRFYFALTGPRTVMSDAEFEGLLGLARKDTDELARQFVSLANKKRVSRRSWFEHVLDRLDSPVVNELDAEVVSGILRALGLAMDRVLELDHEPRAFTMPIGSQAMRVAENCLERLRTLDPKAFMDISKSLVAEAPSISWLVGRFVRDQLWDHGLAGNKPEPEGEWTFTAAELEELLPLIRTRVSQPDTQAKILSLPKLGSYLFGWRELSGEEAVRQWAAEVVRSDEQFIRLLTGLRSWAVSDKVYYPLNKSSVGAFLDWEEAVARLELLTTSDFAKQAVELQQAISQGRND